MSDIKWRDVDYNERVRLIAEIRDLDRRIAEGQLPFGSDRSAALEAIAWDRYSKLAEGPHLTRPETKTVHVWRIEYAAKSGMAFIAQRYTEVAARQFAKEFEAAGAVCVKITGPHQQEVPA